MLSFVLCRQAGQGHMYIVLFCAARWARITCVYCSSIFCRQVGQGHMCLWCNEKGKSFQTAAAVQKHMTDKGHCRLRHEGETLIGEYFRVFVFLFAVIPFFSSQPSAFAINTTEKSKRNLIKKNEQRCTCKF